ncbi:MAG: sugar transferase [Chitinophagaceae bacterium]
MKPLAPIALFCYKRLDTLKQTIEALKQNQLATESELFIFSDGPKKESDKLVIIEIRNYLKTVTGFRNLQVIEAEINKGLAASIISGVSDIINKYDRIIVLEDDLLTSSNFLVYMNDGLDYFESNQKIFSVCGFSIPIRGLKENAIYFTRRSDSCGWGTWKNRWNVIDWDVKDYPSLIKDRTARHDFNRMGSDMTGLLIKQKNGKINSWAIRWCYHQFKHDLYSVHPVVSKIINIGFASPDATHTKENFNRFETKLDSNVNTETDFNVPVKLERKVIRQFIHPYTIPNRVWYKIRTLLSL